MTLFSLKKGLPAREGINVRELVNDEGNRLLRIVRRSLNEEIRQLDTHIKAILDAVAGPFLAVYGVGYDTAAQLLITAGDNPERLHGERSFAALCGATPVKASSGKSTSP